MSYTDPATTEDASLRVRALMALCRLIRDELTDTVVEGELIEVTPWVASELRAEHVYVADIEGAIEGDTLSGGAAAGTDDRATVTLLVRSALAGQTGESAILRVDAIYRAIRRVVLGNEHGQDLDDLANANGLGQVWTELGEVDGPLSIEHPNGYVGWFRIDVILNTNEVEA